MGYTDFTHDTGISPATWTLNGLASGAGRQSDSMDLGTNIPDEVDVVPSISFGANPTVAETVEIYAAYSEDNTTFDGELGNADAAVTNPNDVVVRLQHVGTLQLQAKTAAHVAHFRVRPLAQHMVLVLINRAATATPDASADATVYPIVRQSA